MAYGFLTFYARHFVYVRLGFFGVSNMWITLKKYSREIARNFPINGASCLIGYGAYIYFLAYKV